MIRLARTLWYVLTLRCEEADRVRSVARTEDLTRAERLGTWTHELLCKSCRAARRQTEALEHLVRDIAEEPGGPTLSSGARARILEGIGKNSD